MQVWRHDRGRKRPVDRGHEPLGVGPHAEGAEEQSHADSGLLAWQPGVDSEVGFKSNIFLFLGLGKKTLWFCRVSVCKGLQTQLGIRRVKTTRLVFCY